jgi:hypothetical protein
MAINQFVTTEHTEILQKLVREVVNDPSTYMGSKFIPSIALPVRKIRTEVIEANGGLTNAHVIGTDPEYIQSFGTRVQEFEAPAFKEAIHYDEKKILWLRELGDNGRNMRGIRQYIDIDVDRLNRRLEARIEYMRWQAIFNGGFSYMGNTVSYGVPSANQATPIGQNWSTDGINANNSANPIQDIRYWTLGGLAQFRKYKIRNMVMSPNTVRWILDNSNVQALIKTYFSSDIFGAYELNKTLQMLIPGCPQIVVYDGWYQTENVGTGFTSSAGLPTVAGQISVSNTVYFIPDGAIFFEVSSLPGGDKIGEFVQGVQLASGSIDQPGFGKFLVVDECIAPGTRGGPKNPFLDLIAGVYGGVKMDRPFDLLTAYVSSVAAPAWSL